MRARGRLWPSLAWRLLPHRPELRNSWQHWHWWQRRRYWQQRRYEVLARLEQLGPFHFFFTLSCADKRWSENFTSILNQEGCKISFRNKCSFKKGDEVYEPDEVMVTDIKGHTKPLDEFLEHENLHKIVLENVLTVTKNFDHRVKSFIKHIVMVCLWWGLGWPLHLPVNSYIVNSYIVNV